MPSSKGEGRRRQRKEGRKELRRFQPVRAEAMEGPQPQGRPNSQQHSEPPKECHINSSMKARPGPGLLGQRSLAVQTCTVRPCRRGPIPQIPLPVFGKPPLGNPLWQKPAPRRATTAVLRPGDNFIADKHIYVGRMADMLLLLAPILSESPAPVRQPNKSPL